MNEKRTSIAMSGVEQFFNRTFVMNNRSSQPRLPLRETLLAWAVVCAMFGTVGFGVYSQLERAAMPADGQASVAAIPATTT
jgi:hypothetical protein